MRRADQLEYTSLDDFPLSWRFAEDADRWVVLPEADLRQFRPLSAACAHGHWHRLVTPTADHLMAAGQTGPRFETRLAEYRIAGDWTAAEESERVAKFLRPLVPIRDADTLLFFWGAWCAVETTWDLVLRYWSDFCYPSDDSNVIVPFVGDRLVVHAERLVWVAPRNRTVSFEG
ncbi:MAG TPA: DUF2947 family protein [Isosphaeraceae bacterium]|nr:DUF2947 family protein [Isosphaeraceae bacterium]